MHGKMNIKNIKLPTLHLTTLAGIRHICVKRYGVTPNKTAILIFNIQKSSDLKSEYLC